MGLSHPQTYELISQVDVSIFFGILILWHVQTSPKLMSRRTLSVFTIEVDFPRRAALQDSILPALESQ